MRYAPAASAFTGNSAAHDAPSRTAASALSDRADVSAIACHTYASPRTENCACPMTPHRRACISSGVSVMAFSQRLVDFLHHRRLIDINQPVGWVERSETHHGAARLSDGFRKGSTHPTGSCLAPACALFRGAKRRRDIASLCRQEAP